MKRKALPLLLLLFLLGLLTGCFYDVLSWSPDGRYLSFLEPNKGRLWIWDSKTDQSKIVVDTTGTITATFLPKRWFAGQEMLVGKTVQKPVTTKRKKMTPDNNDLEVLNMKSKKITPVTPDLSPGFPSYDINRKGWVYYVLEPIANKPDRIKYALWGYNIRKGTSQLIYQSDTGMGYPCSDHQGRILMASGDEKSMDIMEVDAGKGTTRSLATSTNPFVFPMWADKGKSIIYLEAKDTAETTTLCRLNLEAKTTESLMSNVNPLCRVQITKDGKWAVATCAGNVKDSSAAARVNLQGKPAVEYLTPMDGSAVYATLSPDGNHLAYFRGDAGGREKVVVKDLKSGTEKIIWQAETK